LVSIPHKEGLDLDNSKEIRLKELLDKLHSDLTKARASAEEIYAEFQDEGAQGRRLADLFLEDLLTAKRNILKSIRKLRDAFATKY
jgi:hypothetical protein